MPRADSPYDALPNRYPDLLSDTESDPALTRLVHDLDAYMAAPVPTERQEYIGRAVLAQAAAEPQQPLRIPARKAPRRIAGWMGTVAAVLVVALLAGTLLTRMHGTSETWGGSGPGAGACAPGDIKAQLPAHSHLVDLAMVAPGEGWAVGAIEDAQNYGWVKTLLLHFHNCVWTPVAADYPNAVLISISMDSATDGWAVGGGSDSGPLALHFTDGTWQQVALPDSTGTTNSYALVRMRSAHDGWIVVSRQKNKGGYASQGLLHYANGHWTQVTMPFEMITDVLPMAQDEAWVAGYVSDSDQTPVLYHFQAGKWTASTLPEGVRIDQLRMVAPDDIWASGHINASTNWLGNQTAAILHFDGTNWQQVAIGASGHPQIAQAFDHNTSWAFTLSNTPNNSGAEYIISDVQYQLRGTWQTITWPFTNLYSAQSLTRVSPDEYWAIGEYALSVPNPNGNGTATHGQTVLLYFANGAWHMYGR